MRGMSRVRELIATEMTKSNCMNFKGDGTFKGGERGIVWKSH